VSNRYTFDGTLPYSKFREVVPMRAFTKAEKKLITRRAVLQAALAEVEGKLGTNANSAKK
jgi:hypothetical protein